MVSLPISLKAYRAATTVLEPAVPLLLRRRARRGKERITRLNERLGIASRARPSGKLVWIHGASVGESMAVLSLIDSLLAVAGRSVLLTSGTVTSADMMAERLPRGSFHQFSPVDTPRAVARFLRHWRPDAGLFVDSEIWPNILIGAQTMGIPVAIINGRMTARSFRGWNRARAGAARLLSCYERILVQDAESAQRFESLGGRAVEIAGSLKADALPLTADPATVAGLLRETGARPLFLATNTHPGEETLLLAVHDRLRKDFPALLTVIVPRHAARGGQIAALAAPRSVACRSRTETISASTEIYVADTMGELGTFYRLAPFVFIGKSLVGHGGQNPIEAARLGVAVLAGPHTENFTDAYDAIFAAQGYGRIDTVDELAHVSAKLLSDPDRARALGAAAENAIRPLGGALERTCRAVEEMLAKHARA